MTDRDPAADEARSQGPWRFVTHRLRRHPLGGYLVANSRRHRKGLLPHRVPDEQSAALPRRSRASAFLHLWAPRRLAWWIALLFAIGSALFALGGVASSWPHAVAVPLRDARLVGQVFFVGSLFFTTAAWLQWLEALNRDVSTAMTADAPRVWRWFGWCPRNLGYLASAVQLAGTLLFNFDTADAMLGGLSWRDEDLLVWTPDMLGSICFLVSSLLAYAEVCQGVWTLAPRSISWWIAVLNLLGSVAFQVSAFYSFASPGAAAPAALFWSAFNTAAGAICFLLASYLMVPELFDGEAPS